MDVKNIGLTNAMPTTCSFASAGDDEHILILVLLSAAYPTDRTQRSDGIYSQLLYLTSAPVPSWTFSNCPAERKAVAVSGYFMTTAYRHIFTISILTLFIGCDNNNNRQDNEINRIVFATGGCYGTCPIQSIDIDSTLTFKYHGVKYTDKKGFYTGVVTNGFWDTLNIKLESINYKQLDTAYDHSVDDLSTEIFIYYKGKVKHIYGQSASLPDSVMSVYDWLLKSIRTLDLKTTQDSLIFPTIIEKPLPMPENIKFVPPTVDNK